MAIKKTIQIDVQTANAQKNIDKLNNSVDDTQKTASKTGKGLSASFKGLGSAISGVIPILGKLKVALISTGVGAIAVAIGSLATLFSSAASKGADFSKSLSGLKAVSGATSDEMNILSDQAKSLGSSTAFTASQVVELQTELAKLGFTVQDIQNSTPAILDLASSLEVDLASAAEFAGSVVRSFGLTTEDTQRVVDVMALSTASSALNFDALTESLKIVAPTSKAVGISVERTAALLGVLADTGLKGSIAGTGLSKTFIELNKQGLTLEQAMDKVRGSSNQLNTAVKLVGIVGAKSLLNLASAGDKIKDLEDKFNNAAGAAKEIADLRLDNLAGDMTFLSSAWEGFLLSIEDGTGILNKISRGAIQFLTKSITKLQDAFSFLSFANEETWFAIKEITKGSVDIVVGSFFKLGSNIKLFSNKAKLLISEIPIIGQAIDKETVEKNIKQAEESLNLANKVIEKGVQRYNFVRLKKDTFWIRYSEDKKIKEQIIKEKQKQKELEELQKEFDELSEEQREENKKKRDEERKKLAKLEEKYNKKIQDEEDKTYLAKAQRQRERALEELNALKLSTEEKRKAEKSINDFYDNQEALAKEKDEEKEKERKAKESQERLKELSIKKEEDDLSFDEQRALILHRENLLKEDAIINAQDRLKLENEFSEAKKQIALAETEFKKQQVNETINVLGALQSVVGQQTVAGKALGIATATINTFQGATEALKQKSTLPSPFDVIAKIANVTAVVATGLKTVKNIASVKIPAVAGGGGGGSIPSAGAVASQPPAFNIVGSDSTNQLADAISGQEKQPIKAYVTTNDVTTGQALERNIVQGASIG